MWNSNAACFQYTIITKFVSKMSVITLSANPRKWSNTLKQFVDNLPTNCLSVFNHFAGLALKGITFMKQLQTCLAWCLVMPCLPIWPSFILDDTLISKNCRLLLKNQEYNIDTQQPLSSFRSPFELTLRLFPQNRYKLNQSNLKKQIQN